MSIIIRRNNRKTFKDIIDYDLDILFVGLNPSPISIKKGHYHQGRLGRRFWNRLKQSNILKNYQDGKEDESLLRNNFGITDLVKKPSPRSKTLTEKDYLKGRKALKKKILRFKPKIICFIYKKAVEKFLNRKIKTLDKIDRKVGDSLVFLLPGIYANKLEVKNKMHELQRLLKRVKK